MSGGQFDLPVRNHVEVFLFREAFYIAHIWLAIAVYAVCRDRTVVKNAASRVLLVMCMVALVAGHALAWWASTVNISIGLPPW